MIEELNLSEADSEAYIELCEEWWTSGAGEDAVQHQMFGHAHTVQNEMELGCDFQRRGEKERWDLPREQYIAAARDWVLLLQVDSDDGKNGPGWMWGDLGMVYFWIHREDLAARAFDRAIADRAISPTEAGPPKRQTPGLPTVNGELNRKLRDPVLLEFDQRPRNAARRGPQSLRKLPACVCSSQVFL